MGFTLVFTNAFFYDSGVWTNADGTDLTYTPWNVATGEPNGGTGENCVAFKSNLIDLSCSESQAFVCKKDSNYTS